MIDMMRNLPPLNWLKAFEAAGRHQNFTRAADELGVTQAAVSQHVRSLEGYFGLALFRRGHQKLVLTDAGSSYLPKLTGAFDLIAAGTTEVLSQGSDKGLTVRVPSSFSTKWLIPRLEKFHASHPNVDIRLTSLGQEANFHTDNVDLEIRNGTGDWPGLDATLLLQEEIYPVCSPALFVDIGRDRNHGDLLETTLLDVPGYAEGWDVWLEQVGARPFSDHSSISFDQSMMAVQAAVSGMGVLLGRSPLVADEIKAGRLISPFGPVMKASSAYFMICPPEFTDRPRVREFRDWLLHEANSH